MRRTSTLASILGLLLLGASAAAAQESPVALIGVVEVNKMLTEGTRKVVLIDVRSKPEYQARHIKGALSVPLNEIEQRAAEVPRQGMVVLY
jgi:rhodanese-related sulfurtransferase